MDCATTTSKRCAQRFDVVVAQSIGRHVGACGDWLHADRRNALFTIIVQQRAASGIPLESEDLNCYLLAEPIAPHIAAANEGVEIDLDLIRQRFDQLAELADVVLVEGVGGFIVPLGETIDSADLAADLDLPIILVVGMRLGCLNHALLTQAAILGRGLTLAGWVANQIDPDMAELDANVEALEERIRAPLLGVIEWQKQPNPATVSLDIP